MGKKLHRCHQLNVFGIKLLILVISFMKITAPMLFFCVTLTLSGCGSGNESLTTAITPSSRSSENRNEFEEEMTAVRPFFSPLQSPGPSDWSASFHEPGQSFAEYIQSDPTVPTDQRRTIYLLPLGNFSQKQNEVIRHACGYLEAFYGLPVKSLGQLTIKRPLQIKNSRINPISKREQIRTGYVLDEVLRPLLPDDAAALIAFTNEDLYPDNSMNYVFGQASLKNRVGVWSLYRLESDDDVSTLLRTIKIAAHETGHMFSMHHCTAYNCVMSGSNHLAETDSHPIDACPECMAKVCWFSGVTPASRYERLRDFCRKNGLKKEGEKFDAKLAAVRKAG